jgi:hypothetical protein
MKYKNQFLFFTIFALGCFLRLFKFNTIPFGLNHDASLNGLVAIDLWQKLPQYTPYYIGWVGETFYHYWLDLNFMIFGISPTTIKLASIIIGIATLPFFYLLAKNLQGKTTALFSSFFLVISGWHMTMSKVGWLAILVPLLQSITFIFLYKALKNNKKLDWIGAGIFLALTLNSYGAARITPLILIVIVFFWYIKHKTNFKRFYKNIFYLAIAFSIVFSPLLNFAINNPKTYNGRANYLSVTNQIKETRSIKPLFDNIKISLGMLHYRANGDDFFVNEPLLEKIPGYLFIIGFIYILFTLKRIESFIIFSWLVLGFVPGILSVPNGNHDFSILVPTYLIVGQGTKSILNLLKIFLNKKLSYTLITLILLLSLFDIYQQYFSKNQREIFGFYPEATIVANYMKDNMNQYDFYLTDNYPRDILTFIMYKNGNPFVKNYNWLENGFDFLDVDNGRNKGLMFFMFPNQQNEELASYLQKKFPNSKKLYLPYINSNISRIASLVIVVPPKK